MIKPMPEEFNDFMDEQWRKLIAVQNKLKYGYDPIGKWQMLEFDRLKTSNNEIYFLSLN